MGIFFRGQNVEYYDKSGYTTILPKIYRNNGEATSKKFEDLEEYSNGLIDHLQIFYPNSIGIENLQNFKELRWALLQHYEKCDTPMIDITSSLYIATSFALDNNCGSDGILYVLGLPYVYDFISSFSSQSLQLINLSYICPPIAIRPSFHEAFVCSHFPTSELYNFKSINQFDFNQRLLAKFTVRNRKDFWGDDFYKIPRNRLYQGEDEFYDRISQLLMEMV